jgi:hypothetical protein
MRLTVPASLDPHGAGPGHSPPNPDRARRARRTEEPSRPAPPIATGRSRAGAFLAERPRREVHDDATDRPFRARALDRRSDPIARVLHAHAGQPGQGERRESATDVRLDGDEIAADADDGDASHASGTYIWP